MTTQKIGYARHRSWQGGLDSAFEECSTLTANWCYSADRMRAIESALSRELTGDDTVCCVGAAGSYGRMEAGAHSDFDLIVIFNDDAAAHEIHAKRTMQRIWHSLEALELALPKNWGIFVTPASGAELTRPQSLGDLDESREIFGKRIQLILDCQPVYQEQSFQDLQVSIVRWYATAFVGHSANSQWTYLMNDLVRYYRSYAAWHQFKLTTEHDDSWFIRNAKLRTSRLVMFAGLMLQIAENTRVGGADPQALLESLQLTPLERVIDVFRRYDDSGAEPFLHHYDACFALLGDDTQRERLVAESPRTLNDLPPVENAGYEPLHAHSAELLKTLTQFTLDRRDDFHSRFWQYLLY